MFPEQEKLNFSPIMCEISSIINLYCGLLYVWFSLQDKVHHSEGKGMKECAQNCADNSDCDAFLVQDGGYLILYNFRCGILILGSESRDYKIIF